MDEGIRTKINRVTKKIKFNLSILKDISLSDKKITILLRKLF